MDTRPASACRTGGWRSTRPDRPRTRQRWERLKQIVVYAQQFIHAVELGVDQRFGPFAGDRFDSDLAREAESISHET